MLPLKTVPVIIVPCPLILKQWSTAKTKAPFGSRDGRYVSFCNSSMSSLIPIDSSLVTSSWPPILAATGT